MPHTSRQKRPTASTQKRLQVTDDDGWTHVTSSTNVRRVLHKTRTKAVNDQDSNAQSNVQDSSEPNESGETELVLGPAEAPGRLTLEELQAQYRGYREKWIASETWTRLEAQLKERVASAQVDAIVCVGLGSPSGFLRGGWVDRRVVSMYQLAALESIAQWISRSFPSIPPFYKKSPFSPALNIELTTTRHNPQHPNPNLRPRPRLQHPRQIPPHLAKHNSPHPPRRIHPPQQTNPPFLPRRGTQTSRAITRVGAVYGVWGAVGGYKFGCYSGVCGEGEVCGFGAV